MQKPPLAIRFFTNSVERKDRKKEREKVWCITKYEAEGEKTAYFQTTREGRLINSLRIVQSFFYREKKPLYGRLLSSVLKLE